MPSLTEQIALEVEKTFRAEFASWPTRKKYMNKEQKRIAAQAIAEQKRVAIQAVSDVVVDAMTGKETVDEKELVKRATATAKAMAVAIKLINAGN